MANSISTAGISENEKLVYVDKLAEQLPVLRIKMGISQDELSSMIGLSRQTYSTLETKKRKMTWSVFLSLIFIFDNCEQTHDFVRENGLFPEKLFAGNDAGKSSGEKLVSQFVSLDLKNCLDEQAIHAIETMIMVEYARCNNMSGRSVVKAFDGKCFNNVTEKDIIIKKTLKALKR